MKSPKWSERCSEPVWFIAILYFVGHVKPWTLKREACECILPGGSSASAVIIIPGEAGSDLPSGWSWASKHTCRLLALTSGDESKRQVKEMGLIIEVLTATVNSEGQLVKVDVFTVSKLETCVLGDVGEWATTRAPLQGGAGLSSDLNTNQFGLNCDCSIFFWDQRP